MGEQKQILIIDDEQDFCLLLKEAIEMNEGFEVEFLTDSHSAEDKVAQMNPDLLLVDNVMPGRNGADVVKALRKNPQTRTLPIIMLSGRGEMVFSKKQGTFRWLPNRKIVKERGEISAERNPEQLCEIYQVDEYVSKPVSSEAIISIIQELLERKNK